MYSVEGYLMKEYAGPNNWCISESKDKRLLRVFELSSVKFELCFKLMLLTLLVLLYAHELYVVEDNEEAEEWAVEQSETDEQKNRESL